MDRREEMRERDRIRKQKEIEAFNNDINVLHNNIDSVVYPSMGITKESDKCFISYYVVKYPNCFTYDLTMKKKEYPFSIYYTKKYYKNDIPEKYKNEFEELEKYFQV